MSHSIVPHEPKEVLVDSVDEVFDEAEASQKRWQEWERKNQLRSVRIQLPEAEYRVLEDLAEKQTKTTPQLIQALLDSILEQPGLSLETATPSAMCRFSRLNGSSNDMRTVSSFPPVCSSLR